MLRADRRSVYADTTAEVVFPAPSPEGAHLRFAAAGRNVQYSLDGGATWLAAQLGPQHRSNPERFQSYWTPIPAGVSRVQLRAEGVAVPARWMVQDVAIWAR
jgi:hypothetical protein